MATLRAEVECGEKTCDGCECLEWEAMRCVLFGVRLDTTPGGPSLVVRAESCLAAEVWEPEPMMCGEGCTWFCAGDSPPSGKRETLCIGPGGDDFIKECLSEGQPCTRTHEELAAVAQTITRLMAGQKRAEESASQRAIPVAYQETGRQ